MRHIGALGFFVLIFTSVASVSAAITPDYVIPTNDSCVKGKYQGDASTYNPNYPGYKTGGQALATGGTYNPNGWEAALQLDIAKAHGCGYGSGKVCQVVVEAPETGKVAVLLVNDNGPLVSGRVIDLNEKSMQYLSDGRYGRNSGVLKNVTVTIMSCQFANFTGPLNASDRTVWARDIDQTQVSSLTPRYGNPSNPYSPLSITPYAGTGATAGYGAMPVSAQLGAQSSPLGFSASGGTAGSGSSSGSESTTIVGNLSALTIDVQPKNARAGSLVLVSWTSVNMKAASCKVLKAGQEFATGNEATKRDVVDDSVEYSLECTTPSGETATSKARLNI